MFWHGKGLYRRSGKSWTLSGQRRLPPLLKSCQSVLSSLARSTIPAFADFAFPFCDPKLGGFLVMFGASRGRKWLLNFGNSPFCEIERSPPWLVSATGDDRNRRDKISGGGFLETRFLRSLQRGAWHRRISGFQQKKGGARLPYRRTVPPLAWRLFSKVGAGIRGGAMGRRMRTGHGHVSRLFAYRRWQTFAQLALVPSRASCHQARRAY